MKQTRYFALMFLLLCHYTTRADFFPGEEDDPFQPPRDRIRRFVRWRVVSRKPDPDAKEESGIGFSGHAMNVLKGGKLGINFWLANADKYGKFPDMVKNSIDGFVKKKEGRAGDGKDYDLVDYETFINPRVRNRD